jgi:SAM-dependent methyltransferase
MKKIFYWFLYQIDTWGSILSTRMTRWSGKSKFPIHPKHLVDIPWHHWYLEYIHADDVVLDAGCNNGSHTGAISSLSAKVYGFDRNLSQLAIAKSATQNTAKTNIFLCCGDAETPWPYPNGSFDVVAFLDVLEHLEDRSSALAEVKRLLKYDGRLLLAVPNRETTWKKHRASAGLFPYSDPDHKHEYTREELEDILAAAGFRCHEIQPVVYDTWLSGLIDMSGGISLQLYSRLAQWKRRRAIQYPLESTGFRVVAFKND